VPFGPLPDVPMGDADAALRPFMDAVVWQRSNAGDDAEDVWDALRWCTALARAGDTEALLDTLTTDVALLSSCYQNADLLPVDRDDAAGVLAQAVLEATHRLGG
jgi:hypothetical protein